MTLAWRRFLLAGCHLTSQQAYNITVKSGIVLCRSDWFPSNILLGTNVAVRMTSYQLLMTVLTSRMNSLHWRVRHQLIWKDSMQLLLGRVEINECRFSQVYDLSFITFSVYTCAYIYIINTIQLLSVNIFVHL